MALRRVHVAYGSASSPASPVGGRPAVPKLRKGWPEIKSARIFSCHNFWIWKNREARPGTYDESIKNTSSYLMDKALSWPVVVSSPQRSEIRLFSAFLLGGTYG